MENKPEKPDEETTGQEKLIQRTDGLDLKLAKKNQEIDKKMDSPQGKGGRIVRGPFGTS